MMKNSLQILLVLIFCSTAKAQTYIPNWSDDIACIVYTRCTSCHNSNGIAPFSLIDYNDAVSYSPGIQQAVNSKKMPPWPPDASYRTLAHQRLLSQQEITLINDWINNGTPQGNITNAPAPPVYSSSAQITTPDLSVVMPNYTIPAMTSDLYRCFVIPASTNIEKYISAIEVLPGNRNAVHHVLVYQDVANTTLTLDSLDPNPGYTSFGGVGSNSAELVGGWVPGSQAYFLPAAMGIKLKANANIIMQIHYPLGTSGMIDSTRLNFLFSNAAGIRTVRVDPILYHNSPVLVNGPLYIPANTIQTFHELYTLPALLGSVTLLTVGPHMHLIATNTICYAVTPLQDTIPLIKINNWDFHWQGFYPFRQPVKIMAGSTLHAFTTYDNTGGNPHNPSNPPQNVSLGENTTDEMMLTYFSWLPYANGDENIVVDTSTTIQTYNGCTFTTSINENIINDQLSIYPNPIKDKAMLNWNGNEIYNVEVYNQLGQLALSVENVSADFSLDCQLLENGIYTLKATSKNHSIFRKLEVLR